MTDPRLDQIIALFDAQGHAGYGEAIDQRAHALQCARLAVEDGGSDELVVAALLHDIGQLIDDAGNAAEKRGVDAMHEETGAQFLARWYAPEVTEAVRLHVAAKRYLCATEAGYFATLSRASVLSLALQGGPMNPDEVTAFDAGPHRDQALRLRHYDDLGKRPDWDVPPLDAYADLLIATMRPR